MEQLLVESNALWEFACLNSVFGILLILPQLTFALCGCAKNFAPGAHHQTQHFYNIFIRIYRESWLQTWAILQLYTLRYITIRGREILLLIWMFQAGYVSSCKLVIKKNTYK